MFQFQMFSRVALAAVTLGVAACAATPASKPQVETQDPLAVQDAVPAQVDFPPAPQRPPWDGIYLTSLSRFAVFRDDAGCLRQVVPYGYAPLVIWENDNVTDTEYVTINATGPMRITRERPEGLAVPVPDVCPGPYIHAGPGGVSMEPDGEVNLFPTPEQQTEERLAERIRRVGYRLARDHADEFVHMHSYYDPTTQAYIPVFAMRDVAAGEALLDRYLAKYPEARAATRVDQASTTAIDFHERADALWRKLWDAGIDVSLAFVHDNDIGPGAIYDEGTARLDAGDNMDVLERLIASGEVELPDYVRVTGTQPRASYEYNMAANSAYEDELRATERYRELRADADAVEVRRGFPDNDALVLYLMRAGMTPARARALRAAGFDPVMAMDGQGGEGWLRKLASFAEHTVVAEVAAIDANADLGDSFRSTITFRVVDPVHSSMAVGDTFALRHASGVSRDGTYVQHGRIVIPRKGLPGRTRIGDRYLLMVSGDAYQSQAVMVGAQPRGDFLASVRDPYLLQPDGTARGELGGMHDTAEFMAELEPLRAIAYVSD